MAKKLLTKDQNMISEVENVLKAQEIEYVKYDVGNDGTIIAVTNRNGEALRKIVEQVKDVPYYFGVLRGKPQYHVPQDLLTKLNKDV